VFEEVKKLSKGTLIVAAVILVFVMCACSGIGAAIGASGSGHNTPTATQAPAAHVAHKPTAKPAAPTATPKPKAWHVLNKLTGNGDSQTADFTVPGANWRIVWSCNPASEFGGSYNVIVDVDPVDTTQIGDPGAINTICQAGNTTGTTNIHDLGAGTYYLNVMSEAAWTMDIETYS
jgi:hypothetical protein